MNTPSHLLVNAVLRREAMARGAPPIPRSAFLLGAVLPDATLWLLWAGTFGYHRLVRGDSSYPVWSAEYDRLYFGDPVWIWGYNLLHAPLLLLLGMALLWRLRKASGAARWCFWFLAGCLVHAALDIPLHVDDGPLIYFPFDWSTRFRSPVSYWDPRYFGREFAIFELVLDLVLLIYLFGPRARAWAQRRRGVAPQE